MIGLTRSTYCTLHKHRILHHWIATQKCPKKRKKKKRAKEIERERGTKYVANLTCYKLSFYKH